MQQTPKTVSFPLGDDTSRHKNLFLDFFCAFSAETLCKRNAWNCSLSIIYEDSLDNRNFIMINFKSAGADDVTRRSVETLR